MFSISPNSPHNVTTVAGQPVILSCGSDYTSVPPPAFRWEVYRPFRRDITREDNAVLGLNGSLYIQKPTVQQSRLGFRCSLTNGQSVRTGYVQLIVEGKK